MAIYFPEPNYNYCCGKETCTTGQCFVFSVLFHSYVNTQYNHHPMRTAHNRSPIQLFCEGAVTYSTYTGARNVLLGEVPDDNYGVDEEYTHRPKLLIELS